MVERWTHAPGATRGSRSVITFPSFFPSSSSSSSSYSSSSSLPIDPFYSTFRNAHVCLHLEGSTCTNTCTNTCTEHANSEQRPSCTWLRLLVCVCVYVKRFVLDGKRGWWSCTTRSRVQLCQLHICVIVPAGSIRPNILSDMSLSYSFVQKRSANFFSGEFLIEKPG